MTIQVFDLAGAQDAMRFSPYCWRTKTALTVKGLDFEALPWRFVEKDKIAPSNQPRVPVIVDGERYVHDSWDIAVYLDEAYPDKPTLMDGPDGRNAAMFVSHWCDATLLPAIRPLAVLPVFGVLHDMDKDYFRESREKALGCRLEDVCADEAQARKDLLGAVKPLDRLFQTATFMGGDKPNYADCIVFGSLMWLHVVGREPALDPATPAGGWFERMLDLGDGHARRAPTARD
ncbi:MAG: glutathione S-transferase N-terminal domain-containing protein [Pseudomonadota bacterium]